MIAGRPLVVQLYITDACDQRCRHCYIYGADPSRQPNEMSFATFAAAVDRCLAYGGRKETRVRWGMTGGDPLLHPEFFRFCAYLHELGQAFVIIANPYHLTDEACGRLRELGCEQVQMSLDGLRESHDRNRRPGSFDATLDRLETIHAAGLESAILTTVSQQNIADVPALVDLCVERRVGLFSFTRYAPVGGGTNDIAPRAYRALLDTCHRKFEEYRRAGCWTRFHEEDHLYVLYRYEEGLWRIPEASETAKALGGCSLGLFPMKMRILADGTVMGCRRVATSLLGNVLTDEIEQIQDGGACHRDLSRYEDCGRCRLAPWCRGCHAVALGQHGNFFARDPQCWRIVE